MPKARIVWTTPNGEEVISYCARVSNPKNQNNHETAPKLLKYCIEHGHWSVFEMANICMEITTTRDISRQMIRHRSFSFQEFSQRYAEVLDFEYAECRMQDDKNRQNSLENASADTSKFFKSSQEYLKNMSTSLYYRALDMGIAKECARKLLPEGLTSTTLYMNGTVRSWLHFLQQRTDKATQKEHREVALLCQRAIEKEYPVVMEAFNAL